MESTTTEDTHSTPKTSNAATSLAHNGETSVVKVTPFTEAHFMPSASDSAPTDEGNQEQENHNPQDATIRGRPSEIDGEQGKVQTLTKSSEAAMAKNKNKPPSQRVSRVSSRTSEWKRRKRGRYVRVAVVDDKTDSSENSFPPLPQNQYNATLRRRAIRKLENLDSEGAANVPLEDYGDTSLGMKLIFEGGRAIVQKLITLSDGRASPAQLAGVIKRGDILLSIDNFSLVNIPPAQLMEGLKPLSEPGPDGSFQRILKLRFETGKGLDILKEQENKEACAPSGYDGHDGMDAATEMFSLFPMVDQLSGAPFFDDQFREEKLTKPSKKIVEELPRPPKPPVVLDEEPEQQQQKTKASPDALISAAIARQRIRDRERFSSEFFVWNDELSQWLRATVRTVHGTKRKGSMGPSRAERVQHGRKVMAGAKALSYSMEELDRGKDMRSFRRWNTTLSLRSRASTRRRYMIDSVSLPAHRLEAAEQESDDESEGSGDSGSLDGVDADELLLGLAAHDGIWRKQVVDALEKAIHDMEEDAKTEKAEAKATVAPDIDSAITMELGTFLFGESMSRIITKRKKSHALPPEEITSVLFDLTTNIASSAPDEITVIGQASATSSLRSSGAAFTVPKQLSQSSDMILASLFLLKEALPIWLKTFRPLPWEHRRVLWPRVRHSSADSNCGTNTVVSDDSLTVGSSGSTRSPSIKGKNLREIIEDQELDMETRAETCFLVTFYFTQQLLVAYVANQDEEVSKAMSDFVKKYGSYLRMHTCLAASGAAKAEAVIEELLRVAEYDPCHRDATREIQKTHSLTFYEATKLSAVVKHLSIIRHETNAERRRVVINMCASAYPDIQPWQVRKACFEVQDEAPDDIEKNRGVSAECLSEHFYTYLSQLLHPLEGHNVARHDLNLVKEWCELSVGHLSSENQEVCLQNFFNVASRASSNHLVYRRDLNVLLKLSMKVGKHDLALDIAGEILDSDTLSSSKLALAGLLEALRDVALASLTLAHNSENLVVGFRCLKRVLRLFHKMSTSESSECRKSVVVADELYSLLCHWRSKADDNENHSSLFVLIDFFVTESSPGDVLHALVLWSSKHEFGSTVYERICGLLRRGVFLSLQSELSGSLLQLKHARAKVEGISTSSKYDTNDHIRKTGKIWESLSNGELNVDK